MEENNNYTPEESSADGGVKERMSFGKWIENVWYHYKWHILGIAFMLLVVIVCTTQCVGKASEPVDLRVIYAGSYQIPKTVDAKGKVAFKELSDTVENLISDYDGNGNKNLGFESYYWLSQSELDAISENNKNLPASERVDVEFHASVVYQSLVDINNLMQHSDYYVWFLSDDLYAYMQRVGDADKRFISLSDYVTDGKNLSYYTSEDGVVDTRAVYLKDLGISDMGNLSILPDDTLVVLRAPSVLDRNNLKGHENAEDFIRKILNY